MNAPLLLDIDLDYFFTPRQGQVWHPWRRFRAWNSPVHLLSGLRDRGISWEGAVVNVMQDHGEAYWRWAFAMDQGLPPTHGATLVHVDAHSDWYRTVPKEIHAGNFILWAIKTGYISQVWWVLPDWMDWQAPDASRFLQKEPLGKPWVEGDALCARVGTATARLVTLDKLPRFDRPARMVTLCSSPGYTPPAALPLWRDLLERFGQDAERHSRIFAESLEQYPMLRTLTDAVPALEMDQLLRVHRSRLSIAEAAWLHEVTEGAL
ncbi:MAG: hypothetical protein PHZ19_05540 [Candidatus Thermoplasmatota archaeon]|nr:hypothetical protein [Candidatus Thermoplasmatota archaeon]